MSESTGNSYSYTYVTNNITVENSFNTKNSHNGHGRASGCALLFPLLLLLLPLLGSFFFCSILVGWLI